MMIPNFFLDRTKQHLIFMILLQSHLVIELQNAENLKSYVTLKDLLFWMHEQKNFMII